MGVWLSQSYGIIMAIEPWRSHTLGSIGEQVLITGKTQRLILSSTSWVWGRHSYISVLSIINEYCYVDAILKEAIVYGFSRQVVLFDSQITSLLHIGILVQYRSQECGLYLRPKLRERILNLKHKRTWPPTSPQCQYPLKINLDQATQYNQPTSRMRSRTPIKLQ